MYMKNLEIELSDETNNEDEEHRKGYCDALDSFVKLYDKGSTIKELKSHVEELENKDCNDEYTKRYIKCFRYLLNAIESEVK